ncbi:MAG TPA: undecaprenyldiphospho-muramoylpentapeptide beta-N-acetylglucosaminyltransferase [Actinomycetota bacterium]|nr:undecaprenyldiphospho-muramoylpentapeptide beta-N-acetylglucosaminyltransferase [Actinomycetota bacterium]
MRVVIAAGGTAGHIFPGLALARRLRDHHGAEVLFVGRAGGQESRLIPAAGFRLVTVESRPFVRRLSLAALAAPVAALRAARRARRLVRGADVAVGMGGYTSVPLAVAAWRERVPLVLHEQNAVPGLANRLASRWARAVALSFAEAAPRFPRRARTVVTGNPVRDAIARVGPERDALAAEAREELGLEDGRRTVVVFGGSQGALHLDRAAAGAVLLLGEREDLQLLIITGPAHVDEVERRLPGAAPLPVRTVPFVERMELVYAAADLAVARAGAGTIAELTVAGIPALLIPYPYATGNHQEANARALQRAGGAAVLLDDQLEPEILAERMLEMLEPVRLKAMGERAAAFGKPDAAEALADLVADAAR